MRKMITWRIAERTGKTSGKGMKGRQQKWYDRYEKIDYIPSSPLWQSLE
jgi:ribosomal protein L15